MALDPRHLRPGELLALLNSTPLGPVVSEADIRRHRTRGGLRIGDGRTVDLPRYVAWLVLERHAPPPEASGYAGHKESARQRSQEQAAAAQDIGELPPVANPERRQRAEGDFRAFCEAYFGATFHLPWSKDHLKVIAKIEKAVRDGGLFALAMPRGSGKTVLTQCACLWAMLFGHREYVCLIGSDEGHAASLLDALRMELEHNDDLLGDFPEVCRPIRRLEGINQRRLRFEGRVIQMEFTAKRMVLPDLPGPAAGAIVGVTGLTGSIRGMTYKRPDLRVVRPDLVIVDDPQTDESARSPSQCAERERILSGAVLGLAGPGRKIAGLMPCTVIAPDDLADRMLNRDKHAEWQGERMRLVYQWPTREDLWAKYAEVRAAGMRLEDAGQAGNAFYAANREQMDRGGVVAWPERFDRDELSAIQNAYNLRIRDERAFFAEYQNEPLGESDDAELLTAPQIAAKINRLKRGTLPPATQHVTAFIDLSQRVLWYAVCAWEEDFTGSVVDYGAFPDQHRDYYTLATATRTLGRAYPKRGLEGQLYGGLTDLADRLLGREWTRQDGAQLRIGRCLVDSGWQGDVVFQFCRESRFSALLTPSKGVFVGPHHTPIPERPKKPGQTIGTHWILGRSQAHREIRSVLFDAGHWKSFLQARLAVALGDRGCFSLFGDEGQPHDMLADHLTAERRARLEGSRRQIDVWTLIPGRDNHWLDCTVGCAVGASMLGSALIGQTPPKKRTKSDRRTRVNMSAADGRSFFVTAR